MFRYPPQPSLDYIKRVVGVPGDEVAYLNKRLTINGKPLDTKALPDFFEEDSMRYFKQFEEQLGPEPHRLLNNPDVPFANIIAIMAGRRAFAAYVATLLGARPRWDKTVHHVHAADLVAAETAG